MICPTCRAKFARDRDGARVPFCSERCRLIDLGKWLGEEYRVADDTTSVPDAAAGGDEKPDA